MSSMFDLWAVMSNTICANDVGARVYNLMKFKADMNT